MHLEKKLFNIIERIAYRKQKLFLLAILTTVSVLFFSNIHVTPTKAGSAHIYHSQLNKPIQLSIQGQKLFEQGKFLLAIEIWQQAEKAYAGVKDRNGVTQSKINIASAQQAIGHYTQACNSVLQAFNLTNMLCQQLIQTDENYRQQQNLLLKTLVKQLDSENKVIGLRSLGDILQKLDTPDLSIKVLQIGLKTAQALASPQNESATLISLGNAFQAWGDKARVVQDIGSELQPTPWRCLYRPSLGQPKEFYQQAAKFYQQAANISVEPTTEVQAQINYLNSLLQSNGLSEAQNLWKSIRTKAEQLPTSRNAVYAQLNLAQSLTCLKKPGVNTPTEVDIVQILATAARQAHNFGDRQAESYALGYLGGAYALAEQWSDAQRLTLQALTLAKTIDAAEIIYQWQWQLGYLFKTGGDLTQAISNYTEAVNTLQSLHRQIAAGNRNLQFSFSETVEPVYRQLIDLLLLPNQNDQNKLKQARNVIESLQIAELENLLRCNFHIASPVPLERLADPATGIIYPIILDNRIEVILSLYEQPLRHYSVPLVDKHSVADRIENWRQKLQRFNSIGSDSLEFSQQLYDWLVMPMAPHLEKSHVKTLVFVLNGSLQNIPVAALHDGQQYLIEKYALAVSPSLELLQPQSNQEVLLEVLAAGISQSIPGFNAPALPEVTEELAEIKQLTNSVVLSNQDFTLGSLETEINQRPFSVIHLATHGQFSSDPKQTYIRAWDRKIDVNQLKKLLQTRDTVRPEAIDLLVLSACDTASGDKRAALGLAGVAVRAGARSTLASLWQVGDRSTAEFMTKFYQILSSSAPAKITKAQALQSAQLELLHKYKAPFYWTPYVLVGNWL